MTMILDRVDSKVKKMMKDDPDFAKQVKKMRDTKRPSKIIGTILLNNDQEHLKNLKKS